MALCDQSLPYIRAISPYLPGKPITQLAREMGIPVDSIVKLASNENPLGMSPKARAATEKAIATLERYPDDFVLKQALADHTGLGMERIVLGNGSTGATITGSGFAAASRLPPSTPGFLSSHV